MSANNLRVYNSLTHKKEDFIPLTPGHVKMYVCGPTVYQLLHVGNFRGPVFFNMVRNWLEYLNYKVDFALNFTDVDDKIIDRANQDKTTAQEVAEKFITEYKTDYQSLGLRPHTQNPKVSEHMDSIRAIIKKLIENKKAYVVDGEVLYSVRSFSEYGKLSNRKVDDMISGSRVEIDPKKKDPLDFALWKPAKPGEPAWDSEWSSGRPGWHIECSAMCSALYGEQIDIHGGGMDLIFPHHENEIAQSEGATNKSYVKYWMHNNMFNFSGQKMSKSLGNVLYMRDFLKDNHAEVFKFLVLSVHYRSIVEFGPASIDQAVHGLARIYSALSLAHHVKNQAGFSSAEEKEYKQKLTLSWQKIESSMNDDFNTVEVVTVLFELVKDFNTQVKRGLKASQKTYNIAHMFIDFFARLSPVMALFGEKADQFLFELDELLLKKKNIQRQEVDQLIQKRNEARAQKDFKTSDTLRDQLAQMGIQISDTPQGTHWEVAK